MENSSANLFKNSLDKAYSQPGMVHNQSTMIDNMKYKQSFKEEKDEEELKGGLADKKTLKDIAKKHDKKGYYHIDDMVSSLKKQLNMGLKVEMEHTKDVKKAREIAMDHLWEDPSYYTKLKKIETKESHDDLGKSARKHFQKDLAADKDYHEFKKRAKYKLRDDGTEYSFGTPNVTMDDPYIIKKKYSRFGKGETKEATGSGSSGAFEGPLFGGESNFVKKSQSETPKIKEEVDKVEAKEATGSGSVGGYESPSMWAKSTKKKDWGPSRKSQIPGGSFVSVKKKCSKFPYCNQGDIKALNITKNESVKEAIKRISKKHNISENVIINILEQEYLKLNKRG
jgi:hypothetical protein